jgi:hypothetical protein
MRPSFSPYFLHQLLPDFQWRIPQKWNCDEGDCHELPVLLTEQAHLATPAVGAQHAIRFGQPMPTLRAADFPLDAAGNGHTSAAAMANGVVR